MQCAGEKFAHVCVPAAAALLLVPLYGDAPGSQDLQRKNPTSDYYTNSRIDL